MLVEAIVGTVVALVVGLLVGHFFYFDPRRVAARALRRPRVDIAAAVPGRAVKVVGAARPSGAAALTLGGERCLYAHTSVHHFYRTNKSDGAYSESWKPVAEESHGGFELVDPTGVIVVMPAGASWQIDERWSDIDWRALSPNLADFVSRHGAVQHGHPAKLREIVIREGQRLSVFGTPEVGAADGVSVFAARKGVLLAIGEPSE